MRKNCLYLFFKKINIKLFLKNYHWKIGFVELISTQKKFTIEDTCVYTTDFGQNFKESDKNWSEYKTNKSLLNKYSDWI